MIFLSDIIIISLFGDHMATKIAPKTSYLLGASLVVGVTLAVAVEMTNGSIIQTLDKQQISSSLDFPVKKLSYADNSNPTAITQVISQTQNVEIITPAETITVQSAKVSSSSKCSRRLHAQKLQNKGESQHSAHKCIAKFSHSHPNGVMINKSNSLMKGATLSAKTSAVGSKAIVAGKTLTAAGKTVVITGATTAVAGTTTAVVAGSSLVTATVATSAGIIATVAVATAVSENKKGSDTPISPSQR